jgi:hypothetical protein
MGIRRTTKCKNKEHWKKIEIRTIKYKDKLESTIKKHESEEEMNVWLAIGRDNNRVCTIKC